MWGLGNRLNWQNRNIPGSTHRPKDTTDEEGVVQILNEILAHRNKKTPTVEAEGGDMIRTGGDSVDERCRMSNPTWRFNICKALWESIRKYMGDRIKVTGPNLSQEMAG